MTRIEVLNDAIQYFWGNESRFCAINGKCQYKATETSEGCAVGRLLPRELAEELPQMQGVTSDALFEMLPENIQELGVNFLAALQDCHDSKYFTHKDSESIILCTRPFINTNQIIFPNLNY